MGLRGEQDQDLAVLWPGGDSFRVAKWADVHEVVPWDPET